MNTDTQLVPYVECLTKQLEEVNMLSSIYCNPGEMHILDPRIINDFTEFLECPHPVTFFQLKAHLEYTITLMIGSQRSKVEVRIELPHLYPHLETAVFTIRSALLSKAKESFLKQSIEQFLETVEKQETYVFQVLSWLQDQLEALLNTESSQFVANEPSENDKSKSQEEMVEFERLWIYSHHIKSKAKRQEIVKQSKLLNLSGFSRPGKPGIICVEGLKENTEEFWKIIRGLNWQKLVKCKSEAARKPESKIDKLRRFEGFKEQLFCDDPENEDAVMDMGLFIKYLESHKSGYMKKELFGIE